MLVKLAVEPTGMTNPPGGLPIAKAVTPGATALGSSPPATPYIRGGPCPIVNGFPSGDLNSTYSGREKTGGHPPFPRRHGGDPRCDLRPRRPKHQHRRGGLEPGAGNRG